MRPIKSLSKKDQTKVRNTLKSTRSKVSNKWKSYRSQKATIKSKFKNQSTIKRKQVALLEKTRIKISEDFNQYREKKYTVFYRERLDDIGLDLFKTKIYKNTRVEFYQSKKEIVNINSDIGKLLSKNGKIKYILVDFVYKDKETGEPRIVSDSFTPEGFDRIKDKDLQEVFMEKMEFQIRNKQSDSLEGYDFQYYTVRAIYHK